MNYFAHGRHFVDDPYFLAGTAVPDWLNVVNRRVRVRSRHAAEHIHAEDPRVARVAAGILQHCHDDGWFHQTRAFTELSLDACRQLRRLMPDDEGFRPHFLGHILVELLLDAALIDDDPARLDAYYAAIEQIEPQAVEAAVSAIAAKPVPNLATFIPLFSRERFLWDYSDDGKLLVRLNQVMRRVGLPQLSARVAEMFGGIRQAISQRKGELLAA